MTVTPTKVEIVSDLSFRQDELLDLYDSVGWSAYTQQPDLLMRSIAGSHRIVAARRGDTLIGLARTISDGATIVYLQDILVHPGAHRTGVVRSLLTTLLDSYVDIRQQVLLTDTDPGQRAFYESVGFTEVHDNNPAFGHMCV